MPRDNSGLIAPNKRKTSDKHPTHKGQATIDGVEYWISGWIKENDRGKFMSLSFERKDAQRTQGRAQSAPPAERDPWD